MDGRSLEPVRTADRGGVDGALRAGQVSVTPLSSGASMADSSEEFQSFIARLTGAFPIASPATA